MSQESLPEPMRYRLREYMHQTGHLRSHARRIKLFDLLSSGLSGEFALRINGKWLRQIPFLVSGAFAGDWSELDRYKRSLLEDLARSIEAEVYAFGENCPPGEPSAGGGLGRRSCGTHWHGLWQKLAFLWLGLWLRAAAPRPPTLPRLCRDCAHSVFHASSMRERLHPLRWLAA